MNLKKLFDTFNNGREILTKIQENIITDSGTV